LSRQWGAPYITQGSGNVSSFGAFNLTFSTTAPSANYSSNVHSVSFTLAALGGNSYASASSVLAANNSAFKAVAHIFTSTGVTGFAADGNNASVPEPCTLLLLGSGLL
jgi:hypothetical protein